MESVRWTTFSAVFMLLYASSWTFQHRCREQVCFSYDIRFITIETKGDELFFDLCSDYYVAVLKTLLKTLRDDRSSFYGNVCSRYFAFVEGGEGRKRGLKDHF